MPPPGSCGGGRTVSASSLGSSGDQLAAPSPVKASPESILPGCTAVPGNPLGRGEKEVCVSGHCGPIGIFNAAFDRDGANCDRNPSRSASEIIVSPVVRERRSLPPNEKRPSSRPFCSLGLPGCGGFARKDHAPGRAALRGGRVVEI